MTRWDGSACDLNARGVENIGVFKSCGFRAKKEASNILWQEFFLCQVCCVCVFLFVFHKIIIFLVKYGLF